MSQPRVVLNRLHLIHDRLKELLSPNESDFQQCMKMLLDLSSFQIDAAIDVSDQEEINRGLAWAQSLLDDAEADETLNNLAAYNVANALTSIHYIAWKEYGKQAESQENKRFPFRLADRETVRRTRVLYAKVSSSKEVLGPQRSLALCNLGNALDESGRWIEAYQCYAEALEVDPNNGNAAGNAAELLLRRIDLGRGLLGHYGAVYDSYVLRAKKLREHTRAIAGSETAARWDSLELTGSLGHVSHEGDKLNDYQRWIKQHRLALTFAVEGLGSDESRWDSAMIESVAVIEGEADPPPIFTSMNVLKAEFLTARRLAYQGETMLLDSLFTQHPDDSGWYADTLDASLYGEPPAMLILAQRASLDLLDKIAVAANEYLDTNLKPSKVTFREFWMEPGSLAIRNNIPLPVKGRGPAIALAELSYDISSDGLYPAAHLLRNAGTHRLVHLTHGDATGATVETHSSVIYTELIEACHESLRVARAAYIYLIDLIQESEEQRQRNPMFQLPLPEQF